MKPWFFPLGVLAVILVVHCGRMPPAGGGLDRSVPVWGGRSVHSSADATVAADGRERLLRSIRLKRDLVPRGTHGRKVVRRMTPRYITIHSTQNWSADAERHALALKRGALRAPKRRGGNRIGYLIWHFTVDEDAAIQHMPTDEQGEHADFDGPGNRYSIGIEMCEERGSDLNRTINRTARLVAHLMLEHDIPLNRVVPHQHWPRKGLSRPRKNCPHFLLDGGRPGRKWRAFLARVDHYHRLARAPQMARR